MSLRSYFSEPLPRGSNLLILLLVLSLATLMVLLAIISRRPTIDSVLPTEFQPGTRLTIVGSHFGEQRGAVILASQRIGANRILNWSNDRVVVEVPPGVPSGLLFVENDRGSSRGVLLTNRAEIPSADAIPLPNRPKILRVAARAPFVGGYVVISGTRLGSRQHDSAVEFTAAWSDNGPVRPPIGPTGYPRWTDDEIVARIPDGAGDGPFWLVVNGTRYLAGTLTVNRPAFGKEYGPGREIAVEHRVRYGPVGIAEDAVATSPGDLSVTLWVPEIEPFPEQGAIRAVQPLPEPTVRFGKTGPAVDDHLQGVARVCRQCRLKVGETLAHFILRMGRGLDNQA